MGPLQSTLLELLFQQMVSSFVNHDLLPYSHEISTEVADTPSLGWAGTNTTYVAIMMDFSVEATGSTESNTTLLHWILPGLSSPNGTTTLTSHEGAIAPYFPPGPPPGQTHTYGVFLYSEPADFAVPTDYIPFFNNLTASVYNRVGFNLTNFVAETGLGAPVAADWFLVSTPNATASSATVSATSSNPSATQSSSGAKIMGVESVLVAVGMLGFAVSLL
jgi:hypothetical protein